jgi:UDP-glucose 4-epimerase
MEDNPRDRWCRLCREPRLQALERGHERAVNWGPLDRGDLRNDNDLARAFKAHGPSAVMHFAAYAYVGESSAEPAKYYDNKPHRPGGA